MILDPMNYTNIARKQARAWWSRGRGLYEGAGIDFEDLYQEALIVLIKACSAFDEKRHVGTIDGWLAAKIRWGLGDHYRNTFGRKQSKKRDEHFPFHLGKPVPGMEECNITFQDVIADIDDQFDIVDLMDAIDRLNYGDGALLKEYIAGKTQSEIGSELGVTESRVCQRLGRARNRLTV